MISTFRSFVVAHQGERPWCSRQLQAMHTRTVCAGLETYLHQRALSIACCALQSTPRLQICLHVFSSGGVAHHRAKHVFELCVASVLSLSSQQWRNVVRGAHGSMRHLIITARSLQNCLWHSILVLLRVTASTSHRRKTRLQTWLLSRKYTATSPSTSTQCPHKRSHEERILFHVFHIMM